LFTITEYKTISNITRKTPREAKMTEILTDTNKKKLPHYASPSKRKKMAKHTDI